MPRPSVVAAADNIARALILSGQPPEPQRQSLWWTAGSAALGAVLLTSPDLPSPERALALFDCRWAERGWHEA